MKITSTGIKNGVIDDKYGKRGKAFINHRMPSYSLPFKIENMPEGTKSFAIVLEDKDAIPVSGFSWIHWVAANITRSELLENESLTAQDFVQGTNSWSGKLGGLDRLEASFYGGMSPPDKTHVYELHIFALDTLLDLERGFYMNEMYKKMEGHILDAATLKGTYGA
jgi:hypothetical protein